MSRTSVHEYERTFCTLLHSFGRVRCQEGVGRMDNLDLMRDRLALASDGPRFSPQLLYTAATLYYVQDATQAEIADRLGTSRATVSRLLSEARRQGIVRIEVIEPVEADTALLAER